MQARGTKRRKQAAWPTWDVGDLEAAGFGSQEAVSVPPGSAAAGLQGWAGSGSHRPQARADLLKWFDHTQLRTLPNLNRQRGTLPQQQMLYRVWVGSAPGPAPDAWAAAVTVPRAGRRGARCAQARRTRSVGGAPAAAALLCAGHVAADAGVARCRLLHQVDGKVAHRPGKAAWHPGGWGGCTVPPWPRCRPWPLPSWTR